MVRLRFVAEFAGVPRRAMAEVMPEASEAAREVIEKQRPTAKEVMRLEYCNGIYSALDEKVASIVDWSFDFFRPTASNLKMRFQQEFRCHLSMRA